MNNSDKFLEVIAKHNINIDVFDVDKNESARLEDIKTIWMTIVEKEDLNINLIHELYGLILVLPRSQQEMVKSFFYRVEFNVESETVNIYMFLKRHYPKLSLQGIVQEISK